MTDPKQAPAGNGLIVAKDANNDFVVLTENSVKQAIAQSQVAIFGMGVAQIDRLRKVMMGLGYNPTDPESVEQFALEVMRSLVEKTVADKKAAGEAK